MPRIRTVKPEFWTDEDLAALPPECRLLALGLLNHADDEGYFKANPALIRAAVFPFEESSLNIPGMLAELSEIAYLEICAGSDGKKYGRIRNFLLHQRVSHPSDSKIKGLCDFTEDSGKIHGKDAEDARRERKGKERKGKERKPTSKNKFSDKDMQFAGWMWSLITVVAPGMKEPNLNSWANDVRLARERDSRSYRELARVFVFANSDSFWSTNILSPSKLRDKFAELDAKMRRQGDETGGRNSQKPTSADRSQDALDRVLGSGAGEVVEGDFKQIDDLEDDPDPD